MLFVVTTNNAFTFNSCRVSPHAIQQQESGNRFQVMKIRHHCFVLRTPLPSIFDLDKFHAVKRGRSIDLSTWPYLGSDDLRNPDLERPNQLVAACASHAPSVKRSCFSGAMPSVNMSKVLTSEFENISIMS
jgi:hypothetical protein